MLQQSSLAWGGEEVTVPEAVTALEFPSLHVVTAEAIGDPQTGDYDASSLVTEFQCVSDRQLRFHSGARVLSFPPQRYFQAPSSAESPTRPLCCEA